jgi:essential nuclear protein 1
MSKTSSRYHSTTLEQDISTEGGRLRTKSITGKRKSRSDDRPAGDGYIDAQSSRKILAIAQDLADEDEKERKVVAKAISTNPAFDFDSRQEEDDNKNGGAQFEDEEDWLPEDEEQTEDVDPGDLAVYSKFLPEGAEFADFAPSLANLSTNGRAMNDLSEHHGEIQGQTTNLADLILQRIAEKEALQDPSSITEKRFIGGGAPEDAIEIPLKVAETFSKIASILSRYKSGPLPKPFKVLPTLPQWPTLLEITDPPSWTPHAFFAATKIFISAQPATAQHFLETVLLDAVRSDIQQNKKLNIHLFDALKKSLYKPAAFFKGFLFPLVSSGATLREASIISGVLARVSIPVLHSAAALLRLCEIAAEQSAVTSEAAGAANVFIRVLLEKKYALPYKAVDALVFHFLRFRGSKEAGPELSGGEKLPVLWHQGLLIFAQRYKNDITEDQREALLDLILVRGHREIGPEVRRELLAGRGRGIGEQPVVASGANGVVMGGIVGGVEGRTRDDGDDTMDLGA